MSRRRMGPRPDGRTRRERLEELGFRSGDITRPLVARRSPSEAWKAADTPSEIVGGALSVAWIDPEATADLETVRERMTCDGELVLAPSGATSPWVRRLSETGFSILEDRHLADGSGWVRATVDPWRLRAVRSEDAEAVRTLFHESFPHARRAIGHWAWKYDEGPWGPGPRVVADDENTGLGAFYGGYPVPFRLPGPGGFRVRPALQMGDTMTAARARDAGRGAAGLLARAVRSFFAVERGRWSFYFGFNTGPIQRFCSWFIGGQRVAPVGWWSRPTLGAWTTTGMRVAPVEATDRSWDRLLDRASASYGFQVHRGAAWVRWRYLDSPDTRYVVLAARSWRRLRGWAVFRRDGDRLLWGDALVDPRRPEIVGDLLVAARRHPELRGAERFETWAGEHPEWWTRTLTSCGFERGAHPQGLALMLLSDPSAPDLPFDRLHYTMGDGDLF